MAFNCIIYTTANSIMSLTWECLGALASYRRFGKERLTRARGEMYNHYVRRSLDTHFNSSGISTHVHVPKSKLKGFSRKNDN